MSLKTFVFDARLPVSETTSKDDPNHPKNLTRGAAIIANQAHADTKYDIMPPPRVKADSEGFQNPVSPTHIAFVLLLILSSLSVVVLCKSTTPRVIAIGVLLLSVHYGLYIIEKTTV